MDIDGQQFGKKFDMLRFFPVDDSCVNGLILAGDLRTCRKKIADVSLFLPLSLIYREEQLIIRKYLDILRA